LRWEDSIAAKDTWPEYILYIPYNEEVTTNLRYEHKPLMYSQNFLLRKTEFGGYMFQQTI
jgi:hypothetical protein